MRAIAGRMLPVVVVLSLWGPAARADEVVRAAGIEIGGKGVKCSVLEGRPGKDGFAYTLLFARTANTTLSSLKGGAFVPDAIKETVEAIAAFYKTAKETYKVPADKIHIVGSSGLPRASNRDVFVKAVKDATGVDMTFITEEQEVALSIAGIVPKKFRAESLLLDIGSGNTKGGYKPDGKPLASAAVPYGTVTFTNRLKYEVSSAGVSLAEAGEKLRPELITRPLRAGAEKMPELPRRKRVYLSGGMVWAMATLLHPEEVNNQYVPLSAADIDAFRALVLKTPGKFPTADLGKITDAEVKKKAEADLRAIAETYTPDNLLAGAEILKGLSDAFDLKDRTILFPRQAFIGWIAAYVAGEGLEEKGEEKPAKRTPRLPEAVAAPVPTLPFHTAPGAAVPATGGQGVASAPAGCSTQEGRPMVSAPAGAPCAGNCDGDSGKHGFLWRLGLRHTWDAAAEAGVAAPSPVAPPAPIGFPGR